MYDILTHDAHHAKKELHMIRIGCFLFCSAIGFCVIGSFIQGLSVFHPDLLLVSRPVYIVVAILLILGLLFMILEGVQMITPQKNRERLLWALEKEGIHPGEDLVRSWKKLEEVAFESNKNFKIKNWESRSLLESVENNKSKSSLSSSH
eukprot:TRINITY_DN6178_c0_g1_i2.p1 TRINITY_DN6178_c0_g1~~TRINITY_DN6178_c0_g1_i2.p1  ORF type:complete len:149 (-),score=14.77 TRINITY_DN6178_c0_g1_i2:166-612(-)